MQRWKTAPGCFRATSKAASASATVPAPSTTARPRPCPNWCSLGGALVGCDAGYLNAARIKGSHAAIKSGMLCAESLAEALRRPQPGRTDRYPAAFEKSWLNEELQQSRNFKAWFKKGQTVGR